METAHVTIVRGIQLPSPILAKGPREAAAMLSIDDCAAKRAAGDQPASGKSTSGASSASSAQS